MVTDAQKEARRESSRKWREKNRDKANEATKRWAEANRKHRLQQQREYRANNRERTRAADKAWREANPEYQYYRKIKQKYGLEAQEYEEMYERQKGICPISRKPLNEGKRSCVDHDHSTGMVRGILSNGANAALGFLEENPEAFYRAVAYLTLDRNKRLIYIIGSLRNTTVPDTAMALRDAGYDAFDNWYSAGETADDSWKEYSKNKGLSYTEALHSREANHVFRFDKAYLDLCDAAILVMPAGKSGHLELGYIVGQGKPAYILLDEDTEKERYDVMPQFATMITTDINSIIEDLNDSFK